MIDLRLLRENPDRVRASQRARGESDVLVDRVLEADARRRDHLARFEGLRAEQKSLGQRVVAAAGAEREPLLDRARGVAAEVKQAEAAVREAESDMDLQVRGLSNVIETGVPLGGEEDYVLLREVGAVRDFVAEGFLPRDHVELGALLGAIDVERAAKVSGARFYYLTGVGALLELALVNMALARAVAAGFTPMIPPALVRSRAMEGTGFLGQAAENVFRLEADDFYLVGTAEVPLAAYHMDEVLDPASLPLRYAGFSPCFRREAGSYGKDTRGIIRVHQFDKVEMFSFVAPADAAAEHLRLLAWEEEFLAALELPYRVIDVAAGDLGSSAARKYDCEAWVPTQGRYREVTSTSNCTQYQSRRLGVRMRTPAGATGFVATLNGTLCAIPRTIVALLENHQRADGSVVLPVALRPYLGGREVLDPVR
ncbi:MAG: serine--tRNA ligase [Actinomycetes bacterium]